jgi:hypothetical protein
LVTSVEDEEQFIRSFFKHDYSTILITISFFQDFCDWSVDSGLGGDTGFMFSRTSGSEQDGVHGPPLDHNQRNDSK